MFQKYVGKFKKMEAEAVQEILDMHDQDEQRARATVILALKDEQLPTCVKDPYRFKVSVDGLTAIHGERWWFTGLIHRGILQQGDDLPELDLDKYREEIASDS